MFLKWGRCKRVFFSPQFFWLSVPFCGELWTTPSLDPSLGLQRLGSLPLRGQEVSGLLTLVSGIELLCVQRSMLTILRSSWHMVCRWHWLGTHWELTFRNWSQAPIHRLLKKQGSGSAWLGFTNGWNTAMSISSGAAPSPHTQEKKAFKNTLVSPSGYIYAVCFYSRERNASQREMRAYSHFCYYQPEINCMPVNNHKCPFEYQCNVGIQCASPAKCIFQHSWFLSYIVIAPAKGQ